MSPEALVVYRPTGAGAAIVARPASSGHGEQPASRPSGTGSAAEMITDESPAAPAVPYRGDTDETVHRRPQTPDITSEDR